MSIRLRLTLFYSAILALTLIAFSITLYIIQTRATYGSIAANLIRQVDFYARRDEHPTGPPPGDTRAPIKRCRPKRRQRLCPAAPSRAVGRKRAVSPAR